VLARATRPENRHHREGEQQHREGEHHVHDPHHDRVEPTSAITRDDADGHADHYGECDADDGDPHGRLHPDQYAGEHVAAEFVGAEPVVAAGRSQRVRHVDVIDAVRRDPRSGDGDEHHDREHDGACYGDRVACQQTQRRHPGLLLDGSDLGMGISRHDSRILGSTNAYSTSTMRLMSRNSAAISSTAPWMTG
jgi:hypothetical protein